MSPPSSAPARSSSSPAAATSPSRRQPRLRRCGPCSTPSRTRVCCRHCAAATSSARCNSGLAPADADHDAIATLRAAADGKLDLLVLLGADPINDCPDANLARRALAGARRIALDRHVPVRLDAAGRPRARGRRVRRAGRHDDQPRGPRVAGRAGGHGARHGAARLDDRRRAGVDVRARHRLRHDRVGDGAASPAPSGASSGRSPDGAATEPPPNSYDYRVVVSRKLYDRAVGTVELAVAGAARRRRRAPTSTRSISIGWASPRAPTSSSSVCAARSCCRWSPTRRSSAARSGRRSTRRAPTSPISSTPTRRSPTCGSSGL